MHLVPVSGLRSCLPRAPRIPVEQVDAFHLDWCLRTYTSQTGQSVIPKADLKAWPEDMGIGRRRFQMALQLLCLQQRIWIEKVGKTSYIHRFPLSSTAPSPVILAF